jgi:hypothetical protein
MAAFAAGLVATAVAAAVAARGYPDRASPQ